MSDFELVALNEAGPQLRAPTSSDRGTITNLLVSGTLDGPSGAWSSTGFNLATGDSYSINSNNVLSQTALGSTVLASSLTSVSALNSGSISSGFGSIDIGVSTFAAGNTVLTQSTAGIPLTVIQNIANTCLSLDLNANAQALNIISTDTANFCISAIAPTANNIVNFTNSHASTPFGINVSFSTSSPDNNTQTAFRFSDSTTERCLIFSDGNLANHDGVYGMISARKLKTDITSDGELRSYWDDVKALKLRKFRMKTDIEQYGPDCEMRIGWIHDEVKAIFPGLAPESPDFKHVVIGREQVLRTKIVDSKAVPDLDIDGNKQFDDGNDIIENQPVMVDGVQTKTGWVKSSVIEGPILFSVVQELMDKVESLQSELESLKA